MAENPDKTKQLLEQLLSELYKEQGEVVGPMGESYLQGQDGQFLGKISSNKFDSKSILNKYGPFGSKYSTTSIFNQYSQYGSKYGSYSINNPYCSQPPKLIINGRLLGYVSTNKFVNNRIPTETFLFALENDINTLLKGQFPKNEIEVMQQNAESFIIANDGTYLGSLNKNAYDQKSIFNEYGPYGSEYSPTSIFNQYSQYGSEFSQLSPFNPYTSTPPKIFIHGIFYGYLTVNEYVSGKKVNPKTLKEWAHQTSLYPPNF
jgi:hypothetical protein